MKIIQKCSVCGTTCESYHDWSSIDEFYAAELSEPEFAHDETARDCGGTLTYYPGDEDTIVVVVVEAGDDYTEYLEEFRAKLTGPESEQVEQAKRLVADRGYRVMSDDEGGCCEYVPVSDGDYISITVYPPR